MKLLAIGLDGFDTNFSGCTTHFSFFLLRSLFSKLKGLSIHRGPFLVRLNPNIPFKTRGNAAVSFILKTEGEGPTLEELSAIIRELARRYTGEEELSKGTAVIAINPTSEFASFAFEIYRRALTDFVPGQVLARELDGFNIFTIGEKSLVGAVSALGYAFSDEPSTFELLVYRKVGALGRRALDYDGAAEILTGEGLFNNYNKKKREVVAVPRGPDPVLIGIRSYRAESALDALKGLGIYEETEGWCLFKTNQHTDAHKVYRPIGELKVYQTAYIEGVVSSKPEVRKGGHVYLNLSDDSGTVKVVFYQETKPLTNVASRLKVGDYIGVLGGAIEDRESSSLIIEAEKLWVLHASPVLKILNPKCPVCGHRMKSAGKEKGYKCDFCGYRNKELEREAVVEKRFIDVGPYTPSEGRLRHLVKPKEIDGIKLPTAGDLEGHGLCRF